MSFCFSLRLVLGGEERCGCLIRGGGGLGNKFVLGVHLGSGENGLGVSLRERLSGCGRWDLLVGGFPERVLMGGGYYYLNRLHLSCMLGWPRGCEV